MMKLFERSRSRVGASSVPVLLFLAFFFGLFIYFIFPKYRFLTLGFPPYLKFENDLQKLGFVVHIVAGIVVYITGLIQFISSIRIRYPHIHRKAGKIYIATSTFCVAGLFSITTLSQSEALIASHALNGTLWMLFVVLAYLSIRRGNVTVHRRFMISSFICASYFVTVRVVDRTLMGFFNAVTDTEEMALVVSDFSVFVVPLSIVWIYWGIRDALSSPQGEIAVKQEATPGAGV